MPSPQTPDSGQAAISLVIILGLFLLGVFGFAIDLTNIWFHRQNALAAADAACQAGALDMLAENGGLTLSGAGFTVGTASNCVSSPSATMCTYASDNGYSGSGLVSGTPSNSVSWTFPSSVSGVTSSGTNPYLQVSIAENIHSVFMSLLTGSRVQQINVQSTCGVTQVKSAPPMVILNPTISGAFTYSGGGTLDIVGGPQRGLQVNSSSATAVSWSASGMANLSSGGGNQTGSDMAIVGGPATNPYNGSVHAYNGGTTGSWKSNVIPIPDPFGSLSAPTQPAAAPSPKWVQYGVDGCPDHYNSVYISQSQPKESCMEFYPGYYASGLNVATLMGGINYATAIFAPGVYYLNGSLVTGGSLTLRNATPSGTNSTNGVMFYFLTGSANFSGGTSSHTIDNVPLTSLTCDGSSPSSALGLPSGGLTGNVLLAQCTQNATYYDSYSDTTDSAGGVRGLVIFHAHSNTTQAAFTGSGALAFSGCFYMHNTNYTDVLSLNGGASTGTYILGEIVVDEVNLSGSGTIKLALNPAATTAESKVAMFN
jgi:hypothetical protein